MSQDDQGGRPKAGSAEWVRGRVERLAYEYIRTGDVAAPKQSPMSPVVDALDMVGVPVGAGDETSDIIRRRIEQARGKPKDPPMRARRPKALAVSIPSPEAVLDRELDRQARQEERRAVQSLHDQAWKYYKSNQMVIVRAAMEAPNPQVPVQIDTLTPEPELLFRIWLIEHDVDPATGSDRRYAKWDDKVASAPTFEGFCISFQGMLGVSLDAEQQRRVWKGIKQEADGRFHAYWASGTPYTEHPADFVPVWRRRFLRSHSLR